MSHGLTKEELDKQFELFLKESVSDDSVDIGGSDKQLSAPSSRKSAQKPTASWLEDDEHSGGGPGGVETAKSRFIKAKKSQPDNNNVFSADIKPVPKPRSKALDKAVHSNKSCRETLLEVSQGPQIPSDDSRSDNLNSPTQENVQYVSGERSPDETCSNDSPAASTDSRSQGRSEDGSWSLRKSQSIWEEEEEVSEDTGVNREGLEAAAFIRGETEIEESVMAPAVNMMSLGMDTLEEEEEKARFFAQLEAGASSTIDYSRLNMELDSTSSTTGMNPGKSEEAVQHKDKDQRKDRDTESARESPVVTGSPHYSEDFEEEHEEEKSKVSPILSKVSLSDSLDDTGGEDRRKDKVGSLDRGQSYVQSGGSEMEALHDAYRQIQVVEDSDDHVHQYSSQEALGRITPPQHGRQSLQAASTTESELPTAEELMRPIRPDRNDIRGFTLQPVSAVELNQEKKSRFLENTFPEVTSPGRSQGEAEHTADLKAHRTQTSPDPPSQNLTWNIRQEVERLMQDQSKCSPYTTSQAGNTRKPASAVSHLPISSVRKPTVSAVRGRPMEGRAAVASRSTGLSPTVRTHSWGSRPLKPPQDNSKLSKSPKKQTEDLTAEPGVRVSSELVASVQSLVSVLQQQVDGSSHQDRLMHPLPKDHREGDSSVVEELRVQLARKEEDLQAMKGRSEELCSLKQHNYLLQSKLRTAEEACQTKRWAEHADSSTEGRLQQMDNEIKEQERLIKGYQQENEKLYAQMKAQQARSKANEEAMFNENQRLLSELASTTKQLNDPSSWPVGNVCSMGHTQRITALLAHINTFQRNEDRLSEDIHRLKQEKQALEVDLQLMKKDRDIAQVQAMSVSGLNTFEKHVPEEKHREEVTALKKRLQWFAENQELLDRDAGRLKAATVEIHQLKEQVEKLKIDVGKRGNEQQRKAKEKAGDMKRMQDLERQVKDLEQILRHRNPNSLPALIYAAATANNQEDLNADKMSPTRVNTLLERRIERLEAELESRDEEAKRSLRTMEQQFHRIKLRYEQQISALEQQLEVSNTAGAEPWMSRVRGLEKDLQHVKNSHQEKEKALCNQIESLQQQLKNKAHPSPGRHQRQAEEAFGVRIERLNQELSIKTRSIQELSRTVDRLQKERRSMLSGPSPRAESRSTETKPLPGPAKGAGPTPAETFPAAHCENTYQPTVFTGSHISEVLQENEALKQRVELLELQTGRETEALKADATHAREELCQLRQHSAQQLSSVKGEHLRALDQLRATHALEHSSSKVAELANKLNTQEMTVTHLQEQLKELQRAKGALVISKTREDALQKQLTRLLNELKEAKEAQSPEVKLLCSLERKILNMELRHQHREKELQQVIGGPWQALDANQQSEVEHWKRVAQDKSRELEAFRQELDAILDILKHLQRQGVVFPITT